MRCAVVIFALCAGSLARALPVADAAWELAARSSMELLERQTCTCPSGFAAVQSNLTTTNTRLGQANSYLNSIPTQEAPYVQRAVTITNNQNAIDVAMNDTVRAVQVSPAFTVAQCNALFQNVNGTITTNAIAVCRNYQRLYPTWRQANYALFIYQNNNRLRDRFGNLTAAFAQCSMGSNSFANINTRFRAACPLLTA